MARNGSGCTGLDREMGKEMKFGERGERGKEGMNQWIVSRAV